VYTILSHYVPFLCFGKLHSAEQGRGQQGSSTIAVAESSTAMGASGCIQKSAQIMDSEYLGRQ
jgi:hypothetical protein